MVQLVRSDAERSGKIPFRMPLLAVVAGVLLAVFLLAPWPLAVKSWALLHGLCAQRPSHSLALGETLLPFDARMTGIYGGFATTTIWLLAKGRFRAWRFPRRSIVVLLAAFVGTLGIDGVNALLVDIGVPPFYPPDNRLRLTTGLLTGIALAVALCHVLATTLWRRGDGRLSPVKHIGEVAFLVVLQGPFAVVALSGWDMAHAPLSLLLIGSAATVVAMLTLASLTMLRLRDRTYASGGDLQGVAAVSLLVGLVLMGAIAGVRFWAEHTFGIVPLM